MARNSMSFNKRPLDGRRVQIQYRRGGVSPVAADTAERMASIFLRTAPHGGCFFSWKNCQDPSDGGGMWNAAGGRRRIRSLSFNNCSLVTKLRFGVVCVCLCVCLSGKAESIIIERIDSSGRFFSAAIKWLRYAQIICKWTCSAEFNSKLINKLFD